MNPFDDTQHSGEAGSTSDELGLLLESIRMLDEEIDRARDQLDQLYQYRRVLVDRIVQSARQHGYESGYSNGVYRYKLVRSVSALDPEALETIVPDAVQRVVNFKVDLRKIGALLETDLKDRLEPYVRVEWKPEVVPETRKTVKSA